MVSFDCSTNDREAVTRIATRAISVAERLTGTKLDQLEVEMDLIATHANGNPLNFAKLEGFDDFNLMHDMGGIRRHLNRDTGELTGFFSPRASA